MFEAVSESWQNRFKLPRSGRGSCAAALPLLVGIFLEPEPKVGSWMISSPLLWCPLRRSAGGCIPYYTLGFIRERTEEGRKSLGRVPRTFGQVCLCAVGCDSVHTGIVYGGIDD